MEFLFTFIKGATHHMKTKLMVVLALLVMAVSAWAADFAGKWTADAAGTQITLTFKVDGNTLTGTVDNPQAGPAEIKEGKIDGDNISFYLIRKMGETDMKVTWKGKASGVDIKFTREAAGAQGGGATEIIAKRAK
jgi:hypothetical protein